VGENKFEEILKQFGGPRALEEWRDLNEALKPVMELSAAGKVIN